MKGSFLDLLILKLSNQVPNLCSHFPVSYIAKASFVSVEAPSILRLVTRLDRVSHLRVDEALCVSHRAPAPVLSSRCYWQYGSRNCAMLLFLSELFKRIEDTC